jgi:hypothetical protein
LFSDSAEDAESLAVRGTADFTSLLASRFLGLTPDTEPFSGGFSRIAYQPDQLTGFSATVFRPETGELSYRFVEPLAPVTFFGPPN